MANACGLETSSGVSFQREDPISTTYEAITSFAELPQPQWTAGTAQCPSFDSVAGWEEFYKNGNFSQAEMTLLLNFKEGDAVHPKLYTDFTTVGTNEGINFRLVFANTSASQIDFTALVTGWGMTIPTDSAAGAENLLQVPITLRPTGQPTFTE